MVQLLSNVYRQAVCNMVTLLCSQTNQILGRRGERFTCSPWPINVRHVRCLGCLWPTNNNDWTQQPQRSRYSNNNRITYDKPHKTFLGGHWKDPLHCQPLRQHFCMSHMSLLWWWWWWCGNGQVQHLLDQAVSRCTLAVCKTERKAPIYFDVNWGEEITAISINASERIFKVGIKQGLWKHT